ncbi:hypothetical protein LCGC14_2428390, partial [marine sediment metagenome]
GKGLQQLGKVRELAKPAISRIKTRILEEKLDIQRVIRQTELRLKFVRHIAPFRFDAQAIKKGKGKPQFEIERPSPAEVGPERAKFKEFGLFLGRGEAFTVFGETGVGRLGGAVVRGKPLATIGRFFDPRRFTELFARTATPTILRFPEERITRFPPRIEARIRRGEFGPRLRRDIGEVIAAPESVGKIFAGPRTSGLGFGELEAVIPPKSKVFILEQQPFGGRFTFSPNLGQFQRVVDVGLKPGVSPTGKFNVRGRVKDVAGIALEQTLGIRSFGIEGLKKGRGIRERLRVQKKTLTEVRRIIPPRQRPGIVRRVPARERVVDRAVGRERVRERPRERVRERPRERSRERVRERPRERPRERIRERIRERPRERPRERIRIRERIRERPRERPRIRVTTEPPPPPFIPIPRPRKLQPIIQKPPKRRKRKFRGTPSLSVVLGGTGTVLTKRQLTGQEAISPLLIRRIKKGVL